MVDITCWANNVPETSTDAFENADINNVSLHVPESSIAAYKAKTPWKGFKEIVAISSYKLTYMVDGVVYKTYNLGQGDDITPEPAPTKEGYTFSGWSEIPETMPAHDVTITGSFEQNYDDGDVTSLIDIILNGIYDLEDLEQYDLNGDGELNIGDLILLKRKVQNSTSRSATARSAVEHLYMDSYYTGIIAAYDMTMKPGKTRALNISLSGSVSGYYGIPFEIRLPEGFSLEKGINDQFYVTSADQADDLKCNILDLGNGAYRLIVYSATLQELRAGSLMSFNLKVDDTMPLDNYAVTIGNVALSDYDGNVTKDDGVTVGVKVTNYFTLLYMVDGEYYNSHDVEYGAIVYPETEPTKEGYTFSGWSEIPETMPAEDVTITGSFTKGEYKMTYIVDGEIYKTVSYDYGATITPEEAPTKEGHTFSGWSEIPETMPAKDITVNGSFTVNEYKLIYIVDGEEYKACEIDYGTTITPETEPAKEGYTSSGWSEIPETMPARNVVVTGSFTVNTYTLTYQVDGEDYKTYKQEYGSAITPEAEPASKKGHTFSGWSEIPETMPAHDVMVTGKFTVNKYVLIYLLDGKEYKTLEVDFGSTIVPEAEPAPKEGYTFSGWEGLPETMPAQIVVVTGTYTVNKYKLTYMIGDETYKEVEMEYGSTIPAEPQPDGDYVRFVWVGVPETMPAHDVTVYADFETGILDVMALRGVRCIYSPNGKRISKLQKGVNIVVMNDGSVKKVYVK